MAYNPLTGKYTPDPAPKYDPLKSMTAKSEPKYDPLSSLTTEKKYDPLSSLTVSNAPNVAYQPESGKTVSGYSSITEYVDANTFKSVPATKESFLTVSPSPTTTVSQPTNPPVKSATPEIILFDESVVPVEIMADLIFENIGGQELLSIARHDTINGEFISNQLIKNMTRLNQEYGSRNILGAQSTSDKFFSNYSIKLESKIPNSGSGLNGSNVYVDSTNGDLVVEVINMAPDEQVEIQITLNGTIYTIGEQ